VKRRLTGRSRLRLEGREGINFNARRRDIGTFKKGKKPRFKEGGLIEYPVEFEDKGIKRKDKTLDMSWRKGRKKWWELQSCL